MPHRTGIVQYEYIKYFIFPYSSFLYDQPLYQVLVRMAKIHYILTG